MSQDGCSATDQVSIKVLKDIKVPNAFSPNGDGLNDTWKIAYLESYPGAMVQVYNRYGQLVFNSRGYGKEWNGTYNGTPLPVGTYYFIIDPKNGRKQLNGSVSIIR
jgi:gliding motility-associated-like protein